MNNYLAVYSKVAHVKSADGYEIPCNYRQHSRFRKDCELCAGLHYTFVCYAGGHSYSRVYGLRTAINFFLDFAAEYDAQNPSDLNLRSLLHISPEVFRAYELFGKRKKAPKENAMRLKAALNSAANDSDAGMPSLILPKVGRPDSNVYEPLSEECFQQISNAFIKYIDGLYKKIDFRRTVESAEPYIFETYNASFDALLCWAPDNSRALKTLISHGHPYGISHDQFLDAYVHNANLSLRIDPLNVVEAIYARYKHPAIKRLSKLGSLASLDELLGLYFPTFTDQVVIALFIQLQTGWNKETVLAIDGDKFEDQLASTLSSNVKIIYSEKQKSQSTNQPYLQPKRYLATSDVTSPYSAYNLIKLAKELSLPFAGLALECGSARVMHGHNPLFLCTRDSSAMSTVVTKHGMIPGRFISIAAKGSWRCGVKRFFSAHPVYENGRPLLAAEDLSGRLRPTWIRYHRDKNQRPLSLISLQQGHKAIATTDIHYDSSGPAMQLRRNRLRSELTSICELLRTKKFKGLLQRKHCSDTDRTTLHIFTVPGHAQPLWGCSDRSRPDWPGCELTDLPNDKCTAIPQCLFCSQVCIFEDSLPFLMHRKGKIENRIEGHQGQNFGSPLSDELAIIEYILEEWGDERALRDAARYLRKYGELMFEDFSSLAVLFEE